MIEESDAQMKQQVHQKTKVNNFDADFLFSCFSGGLHTVETHCGERGDRHSKCSDIIREELLTRATLRTRSSKTESGNFESRNREIIKSII